MESGGDARKWADTNLNASQRYYRYLVITSIFYNTNTALSTIRVVIMK